MKTIGRRVFLISTVMDGDGEWRQVKVCQCPGSGERAGAVCRDIAQIDEETNIGNNTQARGENRERHRSWASQSEQFSFLSHF